MDLCNIVTEVSDEFENALQKEEMKIISHVPDQTMMNGNRSLMYAVIRNLVENSVKYAGKGSEIHIEASRIPGKPGSTEGSGLGLSIVKNAVAFHKGTITASNRKEGGLCFEIEFKR